MGRRPLSAIVLMVMALALASAGDPPELSGQTTDLLDILDRPDLYQGRMVLVVGEIASECVAGCWFILDDGTGSIYVDLNPNGFAIPQKVGSRAKVYGEVELEHGQPMILGRMVEVGGALFP